MPGGTQSLPDRTAASENHDSRRLAVATVMVGVLCSAGWQPSARGQEPAVNRAARLDGADNAVRIGMGILQPPCTLEIDDGRIGGCGCHIRDTVIATRLRPMPSTWST
jgi:hypothetical protein